MAPLDRMKILVQAQNVAYKDLGIVSGLKSMIKNESFLALYKGNGAQTVRIFPYSGIQFFSFEYYKKNIFGRWLDSQPGQANHMQKLLAGGAAGATAVILTYPLSLVQSRLSFQTKTQSASGVKITPVRPTSKSAIINTMVHAFKNEGGIKALYRGLSATLIAIIPFTACNWYTVDSAKRLALQHYPQVFGKVDQKTGEHTLKTQSRLLFASMSAAGAGFLIYPLDVARKRMQLAMLSPDTAKFSGSVAKTLRLIYLDNGVKLGLYRGLSINFIRVVPMFAVQYTMNDTFKEMFGLSTSST